MRNFAICLLLLNLLYLAWNMGWIPGAGSEEAVIVRNPMQPAPQSLVLLSELENMPPSAAVTTAGESQPAPANVTEDVDDNTAPGLQEPAGAAACLALGVFNTLNEANVFMAELSQQGYQTRLQLQEQTESEYRVYMPPFNSDAAARQTLASLLENGIDSFIISEGDLAQAISLGVFSQQESAYRLQEQLAAQGYATSILELVRSNTEFWVVVESSSSAELEDLWQSLLAGRSTLQQSENLCEIVAPEG